MADSDFVIIHKNEYVINSLIVGLAVQELAEETGIPIESWSKILTEEASKQFEQLSEHQINQLIAAHEKTREKDTK